MEWRLILVLIIFAHETIKPTEPKEIPPSSLENENITYVFSNNLNGMVELSTLTVETTTKTTVYDDQLYLVPPTEKLDETETNREETTTRKMRKVLKHIYKRPIHTNNDDEKINRQDVLLKHSDSEKDLLTSVMKGKLTDVIGSDMTTMNEQASTTSSVFENLKNEYKESIEAAFNNDGVFVGDDDKNVFGDEKADLKFKRDHQSGEGFSADVPKEQDDFFNSASDESEDNLFEVTGTTESDFFDISDNEEIQEYIKSMAKPKTYSPLPIETTTETEIIFTTTNEEEIMQTATIMSATSIVDKIGNTELEGTKEDVEKGMQESSTVKQEEDVELITTPRERENIVGILTPRSNKNKTFTAIKEEENIQNSTVIPDIGDRIGDTNIQSTEENVNKEMKEPNTLKDVGYIDLTTILKSYDDITVTETVTEEVNVESTTISKAYKDITQKKTLEKEVSAEYTTTEEGNVEFTSLTKTYEGIRVNKTEEEDGNIDLPSTPSAYMDITEKETLEEVRSVNFATTPRVYDDNTKKETVIDEDTVEFVTVSKASEHITEQEPLKEQDIIEFIIDGIRYIEKGRILGALTTPKPFFEIDNETEEINEFPTVFSNLNKTGDDLQHDDNDDVETPSVTENNNDVQEKHFTTYTATTLPVFHNNIDGESASVPTISLTSLDEIIQLTPEVEIIINNNETVTDVTQKEYTTIYSTTEENRNEDIEENSTEIRVPVYTEISTTELIPSNDNESFYSTFTAETTDLLDVIKTTDTVTVSSTLEEEEEITHVPIILLTDLRHSSLNSSSTENINLFSIMNHSVMEDQSFEYNDTSQGLPNLAGLVADFEDFDDDLMDIQFDVNVTQNEEPLKDNDTMDKNETENDMVIVETTTSHSVIMTVPRKERENKKDKCKKNKTGSCRNKHAPFISRVIFDKECNFSIVINMKNSTMFVPSNVSIVENFENRSLSFTWKSSNEEYNNSLELSFPSREKNINGSLELNLFEETDSITWKVNLQPTVMNKSDWTVDLEGGITISFNNLTTQEHLESNEATSSTYEKNRNKVFHILLGLGICIILFIIAVTFFYIVSRRQQAREMPLGQTSLNQGTIKDKQTQL